MPFWMPLALRYVLTTVCLFGLNIVLKVSVRVAPYC